MLALQRLEDETDPESKLPWAVVTDPANQFNFVTPPPITNWAVKTLREDQEAFYKALESSDPKAPKPSRAGHMWRVKLKEKDGGDGG